MSKIAFVLVLCCVVQYISANALPYAERVKLQKAKIELINEIKSTGIEITASKKDVDHLTDDIKDHVKDELKKLKKIVKEAEKDAKKSGKNIKSCVKAEKDYADVIEKNLKHLDDCEETAETTEAGRKLDEMRALNGVLERAYDKCLGTSSTSKCVDTTIKNVKETTKDIKKQIASIIKHVDTSVQDECVAYSDMLLNKKLEKLNKDWNKCTANA